MSARYRCNQCLHEFTVSEDIGSQSCPYCGSFEVTEKAGGLRINSGKFKKLMVPALVLIGIIVLILIIIPPPPKPEILSVNFDTLNCRLIVKAKPGRSGNKLSYSIDNGRSFPNKAHGIFRIIEPSTYIPVVMENENPDLIDKWDFPITITEKDLCVDSPTPPAPRIMFIEVVNESIKGRNDGQIKINTTGGEPPLKFSINNGKTWDEDSVFINLQPGQYLVEVEDADSRTDKWQDTIVVKIGSDTIPPPPTREEIEDKINRLFLDPENQQLLDSVNAPFISKTMNVECELIGIAPNTPYQLFQFLERRFEGRPGTKRIEVIAIETSGNRISRLKVKEVPVR